MNFTYKNPNIYDKKYAILKKLEIEQKVKKSNEKSIINSLAKKAFIKIQDVETNMIETKAVNNDTIVTNSTDFSIDIDTNIAKKFEMVENIAEDVSYNNDTIVTNSTDFSIDIDTNIAKKFEMVENIAEEVSYNNDEDLIIPDYEKDLYDIKNINATSIHIQDVETTMIETIPIRPPENEKDLYNITNVNENISNKLTIDFVDANNNPSLYEDEEIESYNVEHIRSKGIKIIHNVYQSKYSKGAVHGTGLGDFIRGSYFLLEFCKKYNFEPKIMFNNCISKFLLPVKHDLNIQHIQSLLENIYMFHNNNFKAYKFLEDQTILYPRLDLVHIMADFVKYMTFATVYKGNAFIYCIPYPIEEVSEKSKAYMRKILEPVNEIKYNVQHCLKQVGLNFKEYSVFHIRSGDDYLKKDNKIFYQKYLDKIKKNIQYYICNNKANNYLIIADNNEIKILLKTEFPEFKIILKEITHFGEGIDLEEEKVKNTLIDFYLLSFANKIISLSTYKHGSGFSYWCAKTFDVPYIAKYIE